MSSPEPVYLSVRTDLKYDPARATRVLKKILKDNLEAAQANSAEGKKRADAIWAN